MAPASIPFYTNNLSSPGCPSFHTWHNEKQSAPLIKISHSTRIQFRSSPLLVMYVRILSKSPLFRRSILSLFYIKKYQRFLKRVYPHDSTVCIPVTLNRGTVHPIVKKKKMHSNVVFSLAFKNSKTNPTSLNSYSAAKYFKGRYSKSIPGWLNGLCGPYKLIRC